jgi:hypothetical protein
MVTGGKVNSRWLQAPAIADTDLKSRVVKVQTTLVAGPRNHFKHLKFSTFTGIILGSAFRLLSSGRHRVATKF